MFRIGFGYDIHRLEAGRELWLGGIQLPAERGAVGHSDADVVIHSVCDALLGALALGDIGVHFADTDPQYKGMDSKIFLKKVCELIRQNGYEIGNVDAALCLEKPKIMPYLEQMRTVMAATMQVSINQISIKATTAERLGFIGSQDGVECNAVALLHQKQGDRV